MRRAARLAATATVLVGAGCGGDGREGTGPELETWQVSASPSLAVGEADGELDYLFEVVAGVEPLPGGGVAVADVGAADVRIYDAGGTFVRRIGRRGEGPGEFEEPWGLHLRPPDTLVVLDTRLGRLTTLDTAGDVLGTTPIRLPDGTANLYLGRWPDGDFALSWILLAIERGRISYDSMRIGRFAPDGELREVVATGIGMRRLSSEEYSGPLPFSGHFAAAFLGDTLVWTDGMGGVLHRLAPDGAELEPVTLPLPAPSAAAAATRAEAALADSGAVERLRAGVAVPGADTVPAFSDMLVDDEDHLWVKRYSPATDSHALGIDRSRRGGTWTVATSDGTLLADVRMPDGFRLMSVRGGRLAGVARDAMGVQRVRVYDLLRR